MCYMGSRQNHFIEGCKEDERPVKAIYQIRVCQWLEETEAFRNEFITGSERSKRISLTVTDDDTIISERFACCLFRCFPYCI